MRSHGSKFSRCSMREWPPGRAAAEASCLEGGEGRRRRRRRIVYSKLTQEKERESARAKDFIRKQCP